MKISKFLHEGRKKELEFAQLLVQLYGGKIYKSTINDDIHKHVDLWWKYNGKIVGFDIKSMKKHSRLDQNTDDSIHWIELKNVNGDLGWLFGQAHYIVFETFDSWLIVRRLDLIKFIKSKIVNNIISNSKGLYTYYRRNNKRDIIVKVLTKDLKIIARKVINKL